MTLLSQFADSATGSGLNPSLRQARWRIFVLVTLVLSVLMMFSGYNIYYETRKNIEEERNQRRSQIIEVIRLRPGANSNIPMVPPRLDDKEQALENLRTAIFLNNILILTLLLSLTWFSLYYLLLPVSKAQEERNRFLAEASHELRTPLAILYSDLSLASSENDPKKLKQVHQESLIEIKRLQHLSNTLLADLDSRHGIEGLVKNSINLKELVEDILNSLKSVNTNQVKFNLDIDPTFVIKTDKNDFYRLIFNLLDNVDKYSKKGTQAEIVFNKNTKQLKIVNLTENSEVQVGIGLEICTQLAKKLDLSFSYLLKEGNFVSTVVFK